MQKRRSKRRFLKAKAEHLTADQRRALALLATRSINGTTQAHLAVHGFGVSLIAELVNRGLATITAERVRAGGRMTEVAKSRITDSGRVALSG